MTKIIDIDYRDTWPSHILDVVDKWASELRGTTEYSCDLALSIEYENELRELLSGYFLRTYHCTRFLPNEVRMVKEEGLRPLSVNLIIDRIKLAKVSGAINDGEANILKEGHVFLTKEEQCRENQVCLILSKSIFRHNYSECKPLLDNWGGEGIYKSSKSPTILSRLNSLSKPTVVVALIDLGGRGSQHQVFPALHKVFVGANLGLSNFYADVFYKASVPSEKIESIIQLGDCEFETLVNCST